MFVILQRLLPILLLLLKNQLQLLHHFSSSLLLLWPFLLQAASELPAGALGTSGRGSRVDFHKLHKRCVVRLARALRGGGADRADWRRGGHAARRRRRGGRRRAQAQDRERAPWGSVGGPCQDRGGGGESPSPGPRNRCGQSGRGDDHHHDRR